MVQIHVDVDRCKSPRECRRCLEVCPESVFMTYPLQHREPGKMAADWVIVPVNLTLCSGEKACVEACPQNAITVTC